MLFKGFYNDWGKNLKYNMQLQVYTSAAKEFDCCQ